MKVNASHIMNYCTKISGIIDLYFHQGIWKTMEQGKAFKVGELIIVMVGMSLQMSLLMNVKRGINMGKHKYVSWEL